MRPLASSRPRPREVDAMSGIQDTDAHEDLRGLNEDYRSKYGFHDPEEYVVKAPRGLDHGVVEMISRHKSEPEWMRAFRHEALDIFLSKGKICLQD